MDWRFNMPVPMAVLVWTIMGFFTLWGIALVASDLIGTTSPAQMMHTVLTALSLS